MIISINRHAAILQQLWYMTTRDSTRASEFDAQVQLSTKQQVIGCVQGNIRLQGISRVRKLEHRNTDSNRSTGGNKYYKSKIGRRGICSPGNIAEGSSEDRGLAHINSTALSAKKQNTRRTPDAIFNTTAEDRHDACMMHDMARCDAIRSY